ncbi:MAG: hypothetical protein ACRERD_15400, partial [Candidatus Binatia bacterium]
MKNRLRAALAHEHPDGMNLPELERWLSGSEQYCELVKHHKKRSVHALRPEHASAPTIFVKHSHPRALQERIKNIARPEVLREYRIGKGLAQLGLPVPELLACAWRGGQGLLVMRAIPNARNSTDLWHSVRDTPEWRRVYLQGLSRFLALLLQKKIWHQDLHLGNVLAVANGSGIRFFLVDLYEVRIARRLSPARQRAMLALLAAFHQEISADEAKEVLRPLCAGKQDSEIAELWQELCHRAVEKAHWRWRKRRKALLHDSSICHKVHTSLGTWRLRRGFDLQVAESAIHVYIKLEESHKHRTSVVLAQSANYVVKEFSRSRHWSRCSTDRCSWLNNWRLELCGVPVAKYLGWLRAKNGYGYVIREYIPGVSYDRAVELRRDDQQAQTHLLHCLSVLVQRLSLYS